MRNQDLAAFSKELRHRFSLALLPFPFPRRKTTGYNFPGTWKYSIAPCKWSSVSYLYSHLNSAEFFPFPFFLLLSITYYHHLCFLSGLEYISCKMDNPLLHPFLFLYQLFQWIADKLLSPTPPPPNSKLSRPRIAIIGAGITGVSSAAHCIGHGFDVQLFEKEGRDGLGGIWSVSDNFLTI